MFYINQNQHQPSSSEITPREIFESRRDFIRHLAVGSLASVSLAEMLQREAFAQSANAQKLSGISNPAYLVTDKRTAYKDATSYNNFYEFGTDKADPAVNAGTLKTRPWSVSIEGEVKKPMVLDLDALLKLAPIEERVYRLRCVEGWSMVIPWLGYSLSNLIKKVEPTSSARFVEFISLDDKRQM
ncbi:MAG: protein-methionine-sulfoxide reductase catalytic subunit MsrP, partial [Undibacterium sp.]|nr:protein-methionine-sulfoxide reductase catalytic subunit MsrP [Undibacterium sp.]